MGSSSGDCQGADGGVRSVAKAWCGINVSLLVGVGALSATISHAGEGVPRVLSRHPARRQLTEVRVRDWRGTCSVVID